MRILAIDPGGVHVGMATFEDGGCTRAWEEAPANSLDYVRRALAAGEVDVLIIEEFRLYPWLAQTMSYSDFPTVQLIGAIKFLWATCGATVFDGEKTTCELVMQAATIKDPTRNVLRGRGIKSQAKKSKAGGHAADAELHGWHWMLRWQERKGKGKMGNHNKGKGGR